MEEGREYSSDNPRTEKMIKLPDKYTEMYIRCFAVINSLLLTLADKWN